MTDRAHSQVIMKTLTLSNHYPRTLLDCLPNEPEHLREMLASVGLSPSLLREPKARVPIEAHVELYRRIARLTGDESFGYLPNGLKDGTFAVACEYASNSATLQEALDKICRFYRVVTDDLRLTLHDSGGEARFEVEIRHPSVDRYHFMVETFLCIGYRYASWLVGQAIPLSRSGFAYFPEQNRDEYIFLFPGAQEFEIDGPNYIAFDAKYLKLPVLKTASDVAEFIASAPRDLLNKLIGNDSFTNRVYLVLSQMSEDDPHDARTIASEMAMTEQTLRRKLKAEGTTFQKIKDNLRLDVAVFHLTGNKYTIAEISDKLGFSTPSAFSRAFKTWTGVSPEQYRTR
ncbi:MAG: AraC family transcriptional regulator [Roseovarius indicus]|jgi:AraC-like DNA-binding protein|uniref:AraC family transcriptional regulator n=1 Tax=Roseovarius indicus TaxID=540747 RepID=UPI0009EDF33F